MKALPFTIGDKHSHWELLRQLPSERGHRKVEARCSCGLVRIVNLASIISGQSRSCGQCRRSMLGRKHGKWKSTEYTIWSQMKQRCFNPKSPSYYNYGGRGIKVCESWKNSFEEFFSDVGNRPSKLHTLDRFPNNDGNYEPSNIRWATASEQRLNKRPDIWERIVMLMSGEEANVIRKMVSNRISAENICQHIARVWKPERPFGSDLFG